MIETKRLILTPLTPAVIRSLFESKAKNEIMQFLGCNEDDFGRYQEMYEKGMETHRLSFYSFVICLKESKNPIGEIGFHTWNKTHRRAEAYYMLRSDVDKQKGFMSEAFPEVLKYGFTEMNLHRVEALVAEWNEPSIKLLLKNGFVKEGIVREDYVVDGKNEDSVCYSLLKHEWTP